jgi:hypothetical protein
MGVSNLKNTFVGWSIGYNEAFYKNKADEIAHGGNDNLAAFYRCGQIEAVANVSYQINALLPKTAATLSINILCNIVPIASIPVNLLISNISRGNYPFIRDCWNSIIPQLENYITQPDAPPSLIKKIIILLSKIPKYLPLPTELNPKTIKVINFLNEHSSTMLRVAMIASTVALIAMGSYFCAGAILTAVTYSILDSHNCIPYKTSLFIEKYMPIVSAVGLLCSGMLVAQILGAAQLASYAMPDTYQLVAQKIDRFISGIFNIQGPSLEEIDADVVENRSLNFAEINAILDASDKDYEINPAYCSKWAINLDKNLLPKDQDFDKITALFETVAWEKHSCVKKKLQYDDRFLKFIIGELKKLHSAGKIDSESAEGKFQINLHIVKKDREKYITQVIAHQNPPISEEEYLANYLKNKIILMVSYLNGKERISGSQQELDDAIQEMQYILPYLESLKNASKKIEFEDALLKLAVEGGDYCARGLKRAAGEIMRNVIQNNAPINSDPSYFDPIKDYETKLKQNLEEKRYFIIESFYNKYIVNFFKLIHGESTALDVHTFDTYRLALTKGFYPLTPNEDHQFGLEQLLFWEYCRVLLRTSVMYDEYKKTLNDAIEEEGNLNCFNYVRYIIKNNANLTKDEKKEIANRLFCLDGNNPWDSQEAIKKMHQFVFVTLGILRKKNSK